MTELLNYESINCFCHNSDIDLNHNAQPYLIDLKMKKDWSSRWLIMISLLQIYKTVIELVKISNNTEHYNTDFNETLIFALCSSSLLSYENLTC